MIKRMINRLNVWTASFIGIMLIIGTIICTHPTFVSASEKIPQKEANAEMIPFYWMIIIVGGCIAITLTYVSWRKYRGEQKKRLKKDKNID
ncbi:MAG TPA: sporulation protein YpjB [Bacillota bacterium]|nr:sporulation protein YpjB [Bacillota bacterium]